MINITHLVESISRRAGGMFESVRGLCWAQNAARRVHAEVCAAEDEFSSTDAGAWENVPLRISRSAYGFIGKSVGIYRALDKSSQIFHLHGVWGSSSLAFAAWRAGNDRIPYIVSPRGMLEPWALQLSSQKKLVAWHLWQGRLLKKATCIHALCEPEAISISKLKLDRPICVIPNGVVLPDIFPQTWRSKRLLFLGRIHPKKGLAELLGAFSRVSPKNGWKLIIAGWDDGGHLGDLVALAAKLGLGNDVRFVGPAYGIKKEELFRSSAAFILPSHSEGLPMSVLEAWSYRLPVLMSGECHLPIGFEMRAAIRVDPNVESIERGLLELFATDPSELESMGRNGRDLVSEYFSWTSIAERFADVYDWMSGGSRPKFCYGNLERLE